MLKENWKFVSRLERIADLLIVFIAFFVAYYSRVGLVELDKYFHWGILSGPKLGPINRYHFLLFTSILAYAGTLSLMGAYASMRLTSLWQLFRTFVMASVIVFFIITSILFLTKNIYISRSFVAVFCFVIIFGLTLERFLLLRFLRFWRRKGFNYRNLIIFGFGDQAVKLVSEIMQRPELGLRIRCFADLRKRDNFSAQDILNFKNALRKVGCKNIGKLHFSAEKLEVLLKEYAIDEVIFTDVVHTLGPVEDAILVCAEQGVRTTIAADLFSIGMVKSGISYFGSFPLIHFQTPPGDGFDLVIKRFIDIFLAAFALIILPPFLILVAILIKLDSKGPIFFIQKRVGLNGRLFNLFKFRSMKIGADKELDKLKEFNEMDGPHFKMTNDPRITRLGKFLRKFSIDELPQFWNVLVGDMSIVGPRPPIPGEVNLYERRSRRRLSMRPGLTCIWQVQGRNKISNFNDLLAMDLEYIDNWSLFADFKLMLQTIPAVLFTRGAK